MDLAGRAVLFLAIVAAESLAGAAAVLIYAAIHTRKK